MRFVPCLDSQASNSAMRRAQMHWCLCFIFALACFHPSLLAKTPRPYIQKPSYPKSLANTKVGEVLPLVKSGYDVISASEDFPADNDHVLSKRSVHYDNLEPAPPASELIEIIDNGLPEPEVIVHEILELTSSTTTTAATTLAGSNNPGPSEPLIISIDQQLGSSSNIGIDSTRKFTFLSSESVYVDFSHGKRVCQRNSDCYEMREPDEWCPSVGRPDQIFERGCFCDHTQHYCLVERRNGFRYEHSDCYPKELSKCEVN